MADLLYLAKIGGARGVQNVDLTTLTPVLLSVKLGGSVLNTELTKAILDNLINLQNGTDFTSGTNSHTHDGRYYTISRLVNNSSGSAGSNLIGDDNNYTNFSSPSLTIKSALSGIDAALSALTNANISPTAAIDYSKLANLGGSTGAVLIQNASGFVAPSAIIYTNLLLADGTVPLTGNLNANSNKITSLAAGSSASDAVNYGQVVLVDGTNPFTADQSMGGNKLTNLADAVLASDAVNYGQLTALSLGLVWQGPISDPDLVDDSLSTPPVSPIYSITYIIAASPTGAWAGCAGYATWWDGTEWIDLSTGNTLTSGQGSPVQVGARFLIASATPGGPANVGGSFSTANVGQIVTVTGNTPGAFTYSFTTPLNNWAVSDLNAGSQHANNSFTYTNSGPYTFTVSSANATAGATYTNNGQTFTVTTTIVAGTSLLVSGTGVPTASGTLTLASGTGDPTITFTSYEGSNWINFSGPSKNQAGTALAYNGNTLNVLIDSLTINTNGSNQLQVINNSITNTKLAFMANNTVKGNKSGSSAAPSDLALGNLTEITSSILTITGGSFATVGNVSIQVAQATGSTAGYLSASDWTNFNSAYNATNAATSLATPSTVMKRDASANVQINNIAKNLAAVVTGGGTTTLTAGSAAIQQFIGSGSQTVVLPDATTLSIGFSFTILNRSTAGSITVNANGGSTLATLTPGTQAAFVATNVGTSAGVWDIEIIASYVAIYDQRITVVASSPGANQIIGPVSPGTNVTLPSAETYNSSELKIYLNGQKLKATVDWNTVGSVPRTQVTFVDTLQVGDKIDFVIERQY